jgi:hypothetical protein
MWDIQKEIAGAHFTLEEAVQFGGWNYDSKEKRLIEHLHLWLNSPNLRGPHLGQAQILGKTTLLKLRVIGLLQSSDPKVGGASILSLAEEIAIAIGRLASNGEIIYWYEVIFCLLPMPGILLHNVSGVFGSEQKKH